MNAQWYVTLCGWCLAGLLLMIGVAFWLITAVLIAVALALAIVIIAGIARLRRAGRVIDEGALDAAVRRHPAGSRLPGPGRHQASGVGSGDDTRVKGWTDEEMAYLRGETDTLPAPADIPEENPS